MKGRRFLKGVGIALGVLVGVLVLGRLLADPIAGHVLRRWFAKSPTLQAEFSRVHVSFLNPGLTIERLKMNEAPQEHPSDAQLPLLYIERFEAKLSAAELLRGRLVADARIERPKVSYPFHKAVKDELEQTAGKLKNPLLRILDLLDQLPPYQLRRAEVLGGELVVMDQREEGSPRVWIHDLDATLENFASQARLSHGQPVILGASGTVERSGALSLFVTADPFEKLPAFAGRAALSGLDLRQLHDFLAAKTGTVLGKGTMSLVAGFRAEDGMVRGEVRPSLTNLDPKAANDGVLNKLKAAAGDVAVSLLGEGEKNQIATRVPFEASLRHQDVDLGTAIVNVLWNAVGKGVRVSLSSVSEGEREESGEGPERPSASRRGRPRR